MLAGFALRGRWHQRVARLRREDAQLVLAGGGHFFSEVYCSITALAVRKASMAAGNPQ